MRYTKYGIHRKPGPNMNENVNMEFNDINHDLLIHNIQMFRIINNL